MWIILRTDHAKEQYVAQQVRNLGFQAWVPVQIIARRPHAARRVTAKAHLQTIRELPILPRRVFVEMPLGFTAWAFEAECASIRYAGSLERNSASQAISVPSSQLHAFRVEIDKENTAALALCQKASRKQKAKWKSLHDALVEMIGAAKEQLEQAA